MQVSFIVPLYNCLPLTQAMLASLQATLPPDLSHEIILIDDGSTDGTREWLPTLAAPFRVLLNERNLAYAAANNRGAALARGELLVLLNNDLVLTPRWLEPMLAAHRQLGSRAGMIGNVQRNARTGAVDHSGMFVDAKGKPAHDPNLPSDLFRFLRPIRISPAVTGACTLVERALWRQLDGFDETFNNGGEDVDFCFRARAAGRVNVVALRSVVLHHVSASPGRKLRDEQNSHRLARKWRSELERLGHRPWCWDYLQRAWGTPRARTDYAAALSALAYALHLRRSPPPHVVAGMHLTMEHEFSRWQNLLDR